MRRTEALAGVRMAMFLNILHRWESAELNQEEAAELLGVTERTFRRWTRRYEEEGETGLVDRRLGKASGKRVPVDRAEEVARLYRERYQGFTVKHFHEHLVKDHGFGWGYTWTKLHLQWMGVVGKAPRKGAHRRKRERRTVHARLDGTYDKTGLPDPLILSFYFRMRGGKITQLIVIHNKSVA